VNTYTTTWRSRSSIIANISFRSCRTCAAWKSTQALGTCNDTNSFNINYIPTLRGSVPSYQSQLVCVADLPSHCFGSSALHGPVFLLVPSVKLSTIGGQAFPVSSTTIWSNLPDNVTSSPSLPTFFQQLKTRFQLVYFLPSVN